MVINLLKIFRLSRCFKWHSNKCCTSLDEWNFMFDSCNLHSYIRICFPTETRSVSLFMIIIIIIIIIVSAVITVTVSRWNSAYSSRQETYTLFLTTHHQTINNKTNYFFQFLHNIHQLKRVHYSNVAFAKLQSLTVLLFLKWNKNLYEYQFRFRKHHSTVLPLIEVIDNIYHHLREHLLLEFICKRLLIRLIMKIYCINYTTM